MSIEITDLRKGERFVFVSPQPASFNGSGVTLSNLSLGGVLILHAEPMKIGARSRLSFATDDGTLSVPALVTWSRLSNTAGGFVYQSGLRIETPDPQFARALNAWIRAGTVVMDRESLERKRARQLEREERRSQSKPLVIPTAGEIQ